MRADEGGLTLPSLVIRTHFVRKSPVEKKEAGVSRFAALFAIAGALGLAIVGGALAVPPEHHTDFSDYGGVSSCGTFNDVYRGHLDANIVSKFDKAGQPVQDIVHITGWETNYRSDKPSVSITAHRSFTVIYTYATDSERDVGNVITQTAPGQGVLFHDVGSITFSASGVTIHGPHDVFEQGDAAFCNALIAVTP